MSFVEVRQLRVNYGAVKAVRGISFDIPRGKTLGVARAFPAGAVGAAPRTAEMLASLLSAAVRNVLLYRSVLDSIDDVAEARREAE